MSVIDYTSEVGKIRGPADPLALLLDSRESERGRAAGRDERRFNTSVAVTVVEVGSLFPPRVDSQSKVLT